MKQLSWRWRLGLLMGLALLVYLPALRAGFIWDDDAYVTGNTALRSLRGLWEIWFQPGRLDQYYPLTYSSFWVEYHLWKLNPLGYHTGNVLLHALNSLLVWRVLERLKVRGAWFAGLLFLVHPVMVESVAWITERKNVLSGFFYLFAFLSFLRFKGTLSGSGLISPQNINDDMSLRGAPRGDAAISPCKSEIASHLPFSNSAMEASAALASTKKVNESQAPPARNDAALACNNRRWYFISFALFLLALLSKTVTATFPAALLLTLWWKEGRFPWKDLLRLIPFLAAGIALSSITLRLEQGHITTTGIEEWTFTFAERCLIAGRALWFYLGKLFWPHPLVFIYPRWTVSTAVSWQWYFPMAFLLFLGTLWMFRKRWGRAPFTAFAIFGVTLLPALGFKSFYPMRYSFVADHFQYLAAIAPLALWSAGCAALIKNRKLRIFLGATVLAVLAALSFQQCRVYKNLETLWRDTLAKNPGAWIAHNNLGVVLESFQKKNDADLHYRESARLKNETAEAYYRESIRLAPQNVQAYNNLVKILIETGRYDEAEALIKTSPKTNKAGNHNNLGALLMQKGDFVRAAECFREAVRLEPDSATTHNNLGAVLFKLGNVEEAIVHHKKALELKPEFAGAYLNLGNAYLMKGEIEEAIRRYRKAITFDRKLADAYANLGFALTLVGRTDETMGLYMNALEIDPSHAMTHNNLANFLAGTRQFDKADQHYREAIRSVPNSVFYHQDYASFLVRQGKTDEAEEQYREILKLDPGNTKAQEALRGVASPPSGTPPPPFHTGSGMGRTLAAK